MEQTIPRAGRRSGWNESENRLLWETADEAQQRGLPLKAVFEQLARQTGRRPNSIRNYYYAQVRNRQDGQAPAARFVPFSQGEVDYLMEQVLIARAAGQSVRSCLQKLSGGDHSRMLRYQNKYRAVIKSRPEYVQELVARLNRQGVNCDAPQVNHRLRPELGAACRQLSDEAERHDPELARAIVQVTEYLRELRLSGRERALTEAAQALIEPVKLLLACPKDARAAQAEESLPAMAAAIGRLEELMPQA